MLKPESWAVIATAALGIVAAVMAFIRTPSAQRMRVMQPSLEQRLAESPPEARAVIIRADRRRAFRRDLPWLLAALPLLAFALWFEATRGDACASLFGVGRMRLVTWAFFTVPVLVVAVACLTTLRQTLAILRGGYWPPLDTPVYADTLATTGPRVRLRAIGLLVLMLAFLGMVAYGYLQSARFLDTGKIWHRVAQAELACTEPAK